MKSRRGVREIRAGLVSGGAGRVLNILLLDCGEGIQFAPSGAATAFRPFGPLFYLRAVKQIKVMYEFSLDREVCFGVEDQQLVFLTRHPSSRRRHCCLSSFVSTASFCRQRRRRSGRGLRWNGVRVGNVTIVVKSAVPLDMTILRNFDAGQPTCNLDGLQNNGRQHTCHVV